MSRRHERTALRSVALLAALTAVIASIPQHQQLADGVVRPLVPQPLAAPAAPARVAPETVVDPSSTLPPLAFLTSDPASVGRVTSGLLGCGASGYEAGPCLESVLTAAVSSSGPATAMDALDKYLAAEPDGIVVCHAAAHAAGAAAFRQYDRPLRELLHAGGTNCIMGYIHGVLEAYAESNPDPASLIAAARACDWPEAGGELGQCYDGIGHAAWTASRNLDVADSVCVALPKAWQRRVCEGGIVMQMYAPAYLNASYTLSADRRELVELCEGWPQLRSVDGSDPRQGCWEAVAYMVSTVVTDRWFAAGSPPVGSAIGAWQDVVREATNTCLQLGEDGAAFCTRAFGRYMFSHWAGNSLATAVELCRALDDEHVAGCVQEAAAVAATSTLADETPAEMLREAGFGEYAIDAAS